MDGGTTKLSGTVLTIVTFLVGQLTLALVWAVHQESRITAVELAIKQVSQRQASVMTNLENLQSRVFSQDTPLAKRVDVIQDRVQSMSERLLRLDSQIEQLRSR
jgi:predicted  nucleic acid-binding Zn-ribbon protein